MPTGKKIAIICTILTGILSLVCGIFRLYINVEYNSSVLVVSGKINYVLGVSSADVIGMSTILLFWTQVEVGVANVAICLPAMRPGTLLTSRHSKALLNKIGMSWLASSHGTGQGSRSKRSYVQQRDLGDGPGIHRRSDDDSTAEIKGRISKTVRYSVDLSRRDTSKEGEVLDQRYTLVQYPVRAARKKERPFETV
ncbi:MAG: hypothetical protein M1820_010894 [Bogoriella megaspora]|nr:MAG: hypothetical protein M1820_010894 [Bogoriella megaspora]